MNYNQKLIPTSDGSFTLFNFIFQEHYHSVSGAYQEALEKYFQPLGIKSGFKILDFCFGLGYNSFVACSKTENLQITALENDWNIIKQIETFPYPNKLRNTVSYFRKIYDKKILKDDKNNTISLLLRDAKFTVTTLPKNYFDAVFFDPFSPTKAPDLWSEEIFKNIYNILKTNGKLSTYSCAKSIRKNMKSAGFKVVDGPSVGRKSPSTIAIKE